jgi:hypothetical protein
MAILPVALEAALGHQGAAGKFAAIMPPVHARAERQAEGHAMRTKMLTRIVGAAIMVSWAGAASADVAVYYHVGSWDAFSGTGADGKPTCGVGSTNPVDNRSISLRFVIGDGKVSFEAKKPTWNIPANTTIPVVMQIGLNAPWTLQAVGDGQTVGWTIDSATMPVFDAQFRRATSMTLSFPSGNEPPWTIGLNGSTAISNAFGRCVTDLTQRAGTQPNAPAPSGPTQPFPQAPTQPATPQPPAAPAQTQP